jgi:DNA helicase II / ATP-dependent DNA helicase PcrA
MPNQLKIDSLDIRAIEQALGDVRFRDEDRVRALCCSDSIDIQACPGSGKTTLLVAKLAILARKWRWRNRGVLVLSHTNVARKEVQHRLSGIDEIKLLSYPHFVGTFQKFTNQFLAIPHLRNAGYTNLRIDDRLFGDRAFALLSNSMKYRKAFNFLETKKNSGGANLVRGLRYEGKDMNLGCTPRDLPCGEDTDSGKELKSLKRHLSTTEGIFRYDDMYAIAERYARSDEWVLRALRHRFPWVFIDEMQDTDGLQEGLINLLFGPETIVQRIGDMNQSIFGSPDSTGATSTFPRAGALGLPGSNRFCPAIARIVKPLTRVHNFQAITGNDLVISRSHTIFTFMPEAIKEVLPAFGRLISSEYRGGLPQDFKAKAVGARRTGQRSDREKIPFRIADYYPEFAPYNEGTADAHPTLLQYALSGQTMSLETNELSTGWSALVDGLFEVARMQGLVSTSRPNANPSSTQPLNKADLLDMIDKSGCGKQLRLSAFRLLTGQMNPRDQAQWHAFSDQVKRCLLGALNLQKFNEEASKFCDWVDHDYRFVGTSQSKPNVFLYREDNPPREIEIEISTIHGSKGETHTATLVLDTFERAHDLKTVLPFLLSNTKSMSEYDRKRIKRTFVAMTRPRELLCLALRRDAISTSQRRKLEETWSFVDLEASEKIEE